MARPVDVAHFARALAVALCGEANDALEAIRSPIRLDYSPCRTYPRARLDEDADGATVVIDLGPRPFRVRTAL